MPEELQEARSLVSVAPRLGEMLLAQFDCLLARWRQHRQRLESVVLLVAAPSSPIEVCAQVSEPEEFQISLEFVVEEEPPFQRFRPEPVKLCQDCLEV